MYPHTALPTTERLLPHPRYYLLLMKAETQEDSLYDTSQIYTIHYKFSKSEKIYLAENKKRSYPYTRGYISRCCKSPYFSDDMFPCLESQICHYQGQGNIIIWGDFNAWTGAQPEVISSQGDSFITQQAPTIHLHLLPRNNFDTLMNSNGRELL